MRCAIAPSLAVLFEVISRYRGSRHFPLFLQYKHVMSSRLSSSNKIFGTQLRTIHLLFKYKNHMTVLGLGSHLPEDAVAKGYKASPIPNHHAPLALVLLTCVC